MSHSGLLPDYFLDSGCAQARHTFKKYLSLNSQEKNSRGDPLRNYYEPIIPYISCFQINKLEGHYKYLSCSLTNFKATYVLHDRPPHNFFLFFIFILFYNRSSSQIVCLITQNTVCQIF